MSSLAAHPRSRQLTAIFLTALQAEGYPLGVGHHQAVQELLERLPVSTEEKVLGDCLVALVATTAAEQQHYRELFHAAQRQVKEMEGDRKQEPEDEFDEGHTKDRWRLAWRLLGLLLLVLLPFLAYLLWPPQEVVVPGRTLAVLEQQRTLLPDLDSLPKLGEVRRIELPPAGSSELPQRGKLDTLGERVYFTAYSYDSLAPQDTFTLTLRGKLKRFAQLQYAVVIRPDTTRSSEPVEVVVPTPATPEPDYSPIEPLPYPRGLADLVVAEAKGFGFADFLYYAWWPFLLLMYGALILGYYLYLSYRRRRDVRLIAQRDQFDGAPHFWRIELPELRKSIDWGQHYPRLLRQLRRRREDEHQEIDLGRSIEQTIHQGGLPSFAYRSSSRPAEYLLLIDRGVHNNHYTRLFDELYRQLHAEEVLIERFFYDGDPRLLYPEDRAMTVTLTSLQHRFPNSQLLMVGTGDRLLSPATGKLTKWAAEQLGAWTDRSLLTTLPPSQWGVEEQRLANFFALLPATMQGLRLLVERTEEDEGTRRGGAYRSLISDAEEASINFSGSLVGSLLDHFALPQVQWIAACAIYPSLHWDLTLFFGKQVGEATGNLLLTSRQLLSLARIPWFANGSIPPAARAELTRWLRQTAPALDQTLRFALHETLEQHVPAPLGSVARRELDFFRLQNEWLLAAEDPARRAQLSEQLAREIDAGNAPDVTVVRPLEETKPPEGALPLPPSWAKKFYRAAMPGLGYNVNLAALLVLLATIVPLVIFGILQQPEPPERAGNCASPIVAVTDSITFGQDTVLNLQLCDKLDSLILAEYRWRERIGRAVQLSDLDTLTILDTRPVPEAVDGNMAFNQPTITLAELQDFTPQDSLDEEHLANIGAMLWNRGTELDAEEDCRFFRAAGRLTTLGPARTLVVRDCVARLEEEGSQDDLPVVIPSEEAIIVPEAGESAIVGFGQPTVPKPTMIRLPGGTFRMGDTFGDGGDDSDESYVHDVTLSPFWLGRDEVTFAEYDRYCDSTGVDRPGDRNWGRGSQPVINVSWWEAVRYCNWLSEQHGYTPVYTNLNEGAGTITANWAANGYRLPTETEWEYAASRRRNGTKARFGNGQDTLRATEANFDALPDYQEPYSIPGEYGARTLPVGSFAANDAGLRDLAGNVWEWCWDWYDEDYYEKSPGRNPLGPDTGIGRVMRGGSWSDGPRSCRASYRGDFGPWDGNDVIGFRLARSSK